MMKLILECGDIIDVDDVIAMAAVLADADVECPTHGKVQAAEIELGGAWAEDH